MKIAMIVGGGLLFSACAPAGELCTYDASLCFTAEDRMRSVPAATFKGSASAPPLLAVRPTPEAEDPILLLFEEAGRIPENAAREDLQAMADRKQSGQASGGLQPAMIPPVQLRQDLTAYGYDNGCTDASKCLPLRVLFFTYDDRTLRAACLHDVARCQRLLGTIRKRKGP